MRALRRNVIRYATLVAALGGCSEDGGSSGSDNITFSVGLNPLKFPLRTSVTIDPHPSSTGVRI